MVFQDIIGQSIIIDSLLNAFKSGRTGHALIFSGPEGIGKKTVAYDYAALLLCNSSGNGVLCGQCPSCMLMHEGAHPDFRHVETENRSIGVDQIRELQSDAVIKPLYSSRKVFLISEAENMTTQAQNCLLKILEEPPSYLTFILTTSNYDALLETIRSRAVRYAFRENTQKEVCEFLIKKLGTSKAHAEIISAMSGGIIGKALDMASSDQLSEIREKTVGLLWEKTSGIELFTAARYFEEKKEHIDFILETIVLFLRDLLVYKETGDENLLINSDKKDIILKNAPFCTVPGLVKQIGAVEDTWRNINKNVNLQLSVEVMLLKLKEGHGG